jgi:predicted SAM-dependent methyltransferase
MDRVERLLSLFDPAGVGLEIGPGFNPLISKASGRNIETVDHATAEALRDKYHNDPLVDISRIEDVDYVVTGGSIADTIGKRNVYDYIIASHVIEHVPDYVGFLNDCSGLLKETGVLALAVPDKRFCFDVLQSLSTAGDVLQAHVQGVKRHPAGKIFDFIAYRAMRGKSTTWSQTSVDPLSFEFSLRQAKELFDMCRVSDTYHDIHTWKFTPSSFRLLIRDLHEIGAIRLKERLFIQGDGAEFFISLSASAPGCPLGRLVLAKAVADEQRAITFEISESGSS